MSDLTELLKQRQDALALAKDIDSAIKTLQESEKISELDEKKKKFDEELPLFLLYKTQLSKDLDVKRQEYQKEQLRLHKKMQLDLKPFLIATETVDDSLKKLESDFSKICIHKKSVDSRYCKYCGYRMCYKGFN
jgi:ribosome-binding ATPase YchF (GTP1/OBG family)